MTDGDFPPTICHDTAIWFDALNSCDPQNNSGQRSHMNIQETTDTEKQ